MCMFLQEQKLSPPTKSGVVAGTGESPDDVVEEFDDELFDQVYFFTSIPAPRLSGQLFDSLIGPINLESNLDIRNA